MKVAEGDGWESGRGKKIFYIHTLVRLLVRPSFFLIFRMYHCPAGLVFVNHSTHKLRYKLENSPTINNTSRALLGEREKDKTNKAQSRESNYSKRAQSRVSNHSTIGR